MLQHGYILNNGHFMPALGLGTWQAGKGEVGQAVTTALNHGYRLIDCAHIYENQKEIGEMAIKPFLEHHPRNELFITTKLWMNQVENVRQACLDCIKDLQCEYLDLYLIHWPVLLKSTAQSPYKNEDFITTMTLCDVWKEMEKLVEDGLVKSIGVSNFNRVQIIEVLNNCKIKPVVNQIELNLYIQQNNLRQLCKEHNILIESYRPLGGKVVDPNAKNLIDDPTVKQLAEKYHKSAGQICIKWCIQIGTITIPKSVSETRIKQNFDVFDFEISPEDMKVLETLNINKRDCLRKDVWNGKTQLEFWLE